MVNYKKLSWDIKCLKTQELTLEKISEDNTWKDIRNGSFLNTEFSLSSTFLNCSYT